MPIYEFCCERCKGIKEVCIPMEGAAPECCGVPMSRRPTFPAMVKIMGEGGYPSRRKFIRGSAPHTTRSTQVWGDYDPSKRYDLAKGFIKDEG